MFNTGSASEKNGALVICVAYSLVRFGVAGQLADFRNNEQLVTERECRRLNRH